MDKIVTHHAADPLASMHVSMPDDGRLLALSGLAPEMNALNISTLDAFTSREDFGVLGEGALEILQELGVLLEAVSVVNCSEEYLTGQIFEVSLLGKFFSHVFDEESGLQGKAFKVVDACWMDCHFNCVLVLAEGNMMDPAEKLRDIVLRQVGGFNRIPFPLVVGHLAEGERQQGCDDDDAEAHVERLVESSKSDVKPLTGAKDQRSQGERNCQGSETGLDDNKMPHQEDSMLRGEAIKLTRNLQPLKVFSRYTRSPKRSHPFPKSSEQGQPSDPKFVLAIHDPRPPIAHTRHHQVWLEQAPGREFPQMSGLFQPVRP
ncbi:hypothetical protein HG531_001135 [Fusarium graminearum]|nr:hypothetical protein HG531_001135 [Fusarium graminearum]